MNSSDSFDRNFINRRNIFVAIEPPAPKAIKTPPSAKPPKAAPDIDTIVSFIRASPRNPEDMIDCVPILLGRYPKLIFMKDDPLSIDLWRDIVKAATPKNMKKKMLFDETVLNVLMQTELQRMLIVRNNMKHTMTVMGDSCSKVLLLKIVGELEGCPQAYCLGSGSRPDTRRLIHMYEVEGNVTARRRKSVKKQRRTDSSSPQVSTPVSLREDSPRFLENPSPFKKSRSFHLTEDAAVSSPTAGVMIPVVSSASSASSASSSSSSYQLFTSPEAFTSPEVMRPIPQNSEMYEMYNQLKFSSDSMGDCFNNIPIYNTDDEGDETEEKQRHSYAEFFMDLHLEDEDGN